MTKYEKEVLAIINASYDHLTVDQIFRRLRESHPNVVLATVYNNVNRLLDAGLIHRVKIDGKPDMYDQMRKHDHLICERCGRIADIDCEDLTAPLREKLGDAFSYYDLKVYYLCPTCRAEQSTSD